MGWHEANAVAGGANGQLGRLPAPDDRRGAPPGAVPGTGARRPARAADPEREGRGPARSQRHGRPFPLRFEACEFAEPPLFDGAQLHELALLRCGLPAGLQVNGLRVTRDLDLSRSTIAGVLWTPASTGSDQTASARSTPTGCGSPTRCGGSTGFEADGEVRLIGAHIDGALDMSGARIRLPDGGVWPERREPRRQLRPHRGHRPPETGGRRARHHGRHAHRGPDDRPRRRAARHVGVDRPVLEPKQWWQGHQCTASRIPRGAPHPPCSSKPRQQPVNTGPASRTSAVAGGAKPSSTGHRRHATCTSVISVTGRPAGTWQ